MPDWLLTILVWVPIVALLGWIIWYAVKEARRGEWAPFWLLGIIILVVMWLGLMYEYILRFG